MVSFSQFAVIAALFTSAQGVTNNFRLGVQLSDKSPGGNAGGWGYTGYLQDADDTFSAYTGDSNYYGPDYVRLSLETETAGPLIIEDLDFRLKIQCNDGSATTAGGAIAYTPWASESVGWSDIVLPADGSGLDGVRIGIETRPLTGLTVTDVQVGISILDLTDTSASLSESQNIVGPIGDASELITEWVFANTNTGVHPDGVAIYLSATSTIDPCVSIDVDVDGLLECSATYAEDVAAFTALQEQVEQNTRRINRLTGYPEGSSAMQAPFVQDGGVLSHVHGSGMNNRDLFLIASVFVNVFAVAVIIMLGCQLHKAKHGYKVANYESESVH